MAAASVPDLLPINSFPPTKLSSLIPSRLLLPTSPPPSPAPRLLARLRRPARVLAYSGLAGSRTFDPELRAALDLASDEELFLLEDILYGTSYFSPVLKSIAERPGSDYALHTEDIRGRDEFIERLESRLLFLAADARSTLRGWRPAYRDVLLGIRGKLRIQCSSRLSTEDLEAEIFLHLLDEYSRREDRPKLLPWDCIGLHIDDDNLEFGLNKWKLQIFTALKAGAKEAQEIFIKGGGLLTLVKLYQLFARRLSGKMLMEAANYQIKNELLKKGGQFAAINIESRAALLTARKGFARAASRYLGLRSLMTFLGPVLWGMFLADVVIQMLGTDYARILRAIFAIAQIRLRHTHGWTSIQN